MTGWHFIVGSCFYGLAHWDMAMRFDALDSLQLFLGVMFFFLGGGWTVLDWEAGKAGLDSVFTGTDWTGAMDMDEYDYMTGATTR